MSNLTEFLLARIAEDEAAARSVDLSPDTRGTYQRSTNGGWPWVMYTPEAAEFYVMRVLTHSEDGASNNKQDTLATAFFRHHNPARVLAECEAKWRIVSLHSDIHDCDGDPKSWGEPVECNTLHALALPYADHPDYRVEWKP